MPTKTAFATMLWPILNSQRPLICATGPMLRYVRPWPACTMRLFSRAKSFAAASSFNLFLIALWPLAFAYMPVCNSTASQPVWAEAEIWFLSGAIKVLTKMPFLCIRLTTSARRFLYLAQSRPPSVVSSALFSGTRVTWSGRIRSAILTMGSAIDISRFSLQATVSLSSLTSRSLM